MIVKYIKGDIVALFLQGNIIAHGCNCFHTMGSGVAGQLARAYPKILEIDKKTTPVVFLLWGANARKKAEIIKNPIHQKLITVHPSPLSAYNGFFGCKHFSKTNEILISSGQTPIDWSLV